jgi:hypothetical protein
MSFALVAPTADIAISPALGVHLPPESSMSN